MIVLIRGGSIAAGVQTSTCYADLLKEKFADTDIDIVNRSREKDSSFEGIWSFYEDIDPVRPDFLILHFGIDDMYRPVYRSEFKENLVQIVRLARQRFNPHIALLTSQPFEDPGEMDSAQIYYRTVREVSLDLDCMFVPVHLLWSGHLHESGLRHRDLVNSDYRYPNEEGHRLLCNIIYDRICSIRFFHENQ
ncbi:MAG TPA: SGNH/GDSL hydrolase family protein [Spirochaetota bacterium]|nr:SGNH/GDSL hydrolase family protein [Spirochaetota bacterium]